MEVRIRLQKAGLRSKKRYNYRVVAISRSSKRQGDHLELLGYYDPAKEPASLKIDQDKLKKWLERGAQMSDTVKSLLKKATKKN